MMISTKKARLELNTLIIIVVAILVILLLAFLIFDNQILDWFKNLPGYEGEDSGDRLIDELPEDIQIQLNYFKVALVQGGTKIDFCTEGDCSKLRPSNLYWDGSEIKATIYVAENGLFGFDSWDLDDEVGNVFDGRVSILKSILRDSSKPELPPKEDLANLDGGIYISGIIYRDRSASDQEDFDWNKIMEEYEKTKCVVSENSCQIAEFPCACFTEGAFNRKEMFDICDEDTPYCYNQRHGCSSRSPDSVLGIQTCKESLGDKFVQAPKCEVDTTSCSVLNSPCTCPAKGTLRAFNEDNSIALPTCIESEYCSYGVHGCTDDSPDNPLGLDACKESLGDKYTEPAECEVDTSTCSVLKSPCTCPTFGDLVDKERGNEYSPGVCSSNQYCYYGKEGCFDRGGDSYIGSCKETLGSKFVQAPDCNIDGENKVTNAPCTCGTFGGLAQIEQGKDIALETCKSGQYCYVNSVGCSDTEK